jgi:D-3-phosphoglycerate dehydrogenase
MTFKIGITRDLLTAKGEPCFDPRAFARLDANPAITWEWLPENVTEITPDIAARYDGLHINLPRVTATSVGRGDARVKIIARNGVGYDTVDVAACTAKGIIVTNTPIAVRRPVAVAALTLIFALAGRLTDKNAIVRAGRWNDRTDYMGQGLTTRTLAVIGAGSIGEELLTLARPFFGRLVAADPYADPARLRSLGTDLMPIQSALAAGDFVVVACLLNDETRHLINAARIACMKRSAFLINVARGPIVDETALIAALRAGEIAGAGLDVTEREPIEPESPLLAMANVLITAHALCWTDECFRDIAETALQSIVDVSLGRRPRHVVAPPLR